MGNYNLCTFALTDEEKEIVDFFIHELGVIETETVGGTFYSAEVNSRIDKRREMIKQKIMEVIY